MNRYSSTSPRQWGGATNAPQKSKKPAKKRAFLNLAPLTGIALGINWLSGKPNLKVRVVKTTRMTTNGR
ncbi:hypothetical protein EHJ16_12395 [Cronobacter dublinensis]|nr:hypothetical protein [Cronobacter dublinensis]